MVISRILYNHLKEKLQKGKIVVLYGPRRTGKTFLLEKIADELETTEKVLFLNGENLTVEENLSSRIPEQLKRYIGEASVVIIDEAQKIASVGDHLKLLVDSMPNVSFIASGSASFDLSQKIGEPLTGRKKTLVLYPISAKEIISAKNTNYYLSSLEHFVIYGSYPELFSIASNEQQKEYLLELKNSLLFKDILELENLRNAKKLQDLLRLIAFQIGNEVSLSELGNSLELHKDTVFRYLDLLEKAFVIFNIRGFSRNLRKEVVKTSRYYFYDNGVRNAVISNFNPISSRDDIGMLWENYIIAERLKKQAYSSLYSNNYFWRTYDQKEIDWVEERDGKLYGFEIKWGEKEPRAPKGWLETYPNASYNFVNKNNFLEFIT